MRRMALWLATVADLPEIIGVSRSYPSITSPGRCQYDVCGVLPEGVEPAGDMSQQVLAEGLTAVYRCELGTDDLFFRGQTVFNWLTNEWLPGSGYQPDDRPVYKLFLETPDENPQGNHLFEFCCPLRPLSVSVCET